MIKPLLVLAAMLLVAPAFAGQGAKVDVAGPASFDEQRARVVADLADGETYTEISAEDRTQVVSTLDRMQALLGAHASVQALHPDDRVQLLNQQEIVNNILTQAEKDSRMVCRREAAIGTRLASTVCRTVAERRRLQDNSRRDLEAAGRSRAKRVQ